MEIYKVNYSVELRQRKAAQKCRGGSPSVVQCEDKYMLRGPDKKGVNLCEHGVKKKKQYMTLSNSTFRSNFSDSRAQKKRSVFY